jgi:flagellar biosynthesis activator protein FlaF
MSSPALNSYASAERATSSGRQLEASALFRVARGLQTAQEQWGSPGHQEKLDHALKQNQKLWTFFQSELSMPDNQLPADLKASLLQLVAFIDRRTFDIMAFPAAEKLNVLISINRNIAAGLSTAGASTTPGSR